MYYLCAEYIGIYYSIFCIFFLNTEKEAGTWLGPQDVSLHANAGSEDEVECPLRPDGLHRKAAAQPRGTGS